MKLFHGSDEKLNFDVIPHSGHVFHGMFFAYEIEAAKSHGDYIYTTEIKGDDIIAASDFAYDSDACKIINKMFDLQSFDTELFIDLIAGTRSLVQLIRKNDEIDMGTDEEKFDFNALSKVLNLKGAEWNEIDFELQSVAAKVAEKMGYKGVELEDEHGSVVLVCPGAKIELVKSPSQPKKAHTLWDTLSEKGEL